MARGPALFAVDKHEASTLLIDLHLIGNSCMYREVLAYRWQHLFVGAKWYIGQIHYKYNITTCSKVKY